MSANDPASGYIYLCGMLSELPKERQAAIVELQDKIRTMVLAAGENGMLALALVSTELGSKQDL